MTTVSLKELRRKLGRLIRAGRPVLLTRRGRPVARLVPLRPRTMAAERYERIRRYAGIVDDPAIPRNGSAHLDEFLYGPARSGR